jgi:hypothetical protein
MNTRLLAASLAAAAGTAAAHEGHGEVGPHWHATDVWGFLFIVIVLAAIAWWRAKP